uniref:Autophagy related 2B n=1 Tax=Scleropages formosus TaxID=113540 RepID=A0A8C9WD17_SCLFO
MPWPFSESIKKRACRYLLHRYLGHFLQEKLSLDQLSLDLYQGTGSLAQVPLDKWSLNEILESVDAPFEVTEGFIKTISLTVPWAFLLQENCALEVTGLEMVFRPRPRMASSTEPMYWSSFMTSSMQLAKECLNQRLTDELGEGLQPLEGLEKFAETIETVLRRVKVTFLETVLRIEHLTDLMLLRTVYFDETGDECHGMDVHQPSTFAHKSLQLHGITVFWDEFSESARSNPKSPPAQTVSVTGLFWPAIMANLVDRGGLAKDRKSRPMQQEDEYRLHMELNRCLKKDSMVPSPLADTDFFETETTRTTSSRGRYEYIPDWDMFLVFLRFNSLFLLLVHDMKLHVYEAVPNDGLDEPFLRPLNPPLQSRFLGAGMKMTYEQREGSSLRSLSTDISLGQMELLECLFPSDDCSNTPQYTEVRKSLFSSPAPCLHLTYKFVERRGPQVNSEPISRTCRCHKAFAEVFLDDSRTPANCHISVAVNAPVLNLVVRFPIPDLRSDQERGPWFKKSLQKEALCLELQDLELKTEFTGGSSSEQTKMELTFRELTGDTYVTLHRVVLRVNPTSVHSILERVTAEEEEGPEGHSPEEEEGGAHSLKDVCDFGKPEPSPFSSRRVMYENEEMIMPGDVGEMTEFQEKTMSDSRYVLELAFPNVQLLLPSKAFYEKLHNRINNDLLLWEPTAPSPVETVENMTYGVGLSVASQLINTYSKDSFSQFRSAAPEGTVEENKTMLKHRHGEFWMEVENGVLFSVTQYEGHKDQHYVCLHTSNLCLYHQVRGATLQHRVVPSSLDFLNVSDEPVLGYTPPVSITTFHLHLWSCSLDYRPLYLPIRSLLTVETFSISSSVSLDHSSSTLRIILDEAALFLSDKCNVVSVNLSRDYVQVMDMGMLELRITATEPRFELRCSSDVIHIRTCSDSCAALMNLIQYIASYGDLLPPPGLEGKSSSAKHRAKVTGIHDLSQEHEPARSDLFLFPDESGNMSQEPSPTFPVYHTPLIYTATLDPAPDSEDFCILETPGSGTAGRDEEPVVNKLTAEPIQIRDNHFSQPLGRTDSSRGPLHFPVPEVRYLIKEISVVWHLYGGKDFGSGVFISSPARSRGCTPHSSPSQTPIRQSRSVGRIGGGRGRNPDVLMEIQLTKVKFQHEVYPQGRVEPSSGPAEQPASRQVFIVQDLEIRDRLASSQMNKFLYLYSSKEMPRKAHSNMLTVKALHLCPEAGHAPQECCLRVSLMPLRLNIDQDALFFLKDFFTSLTAEVELFAPLMWSVLNVWLTLFSFAAVNFREFRFTSEVPIRLDYHGKHVSMEQGTFAGIIIGLTQLNCSELKLRRLCYRQGLLGVDKLFSYAINEWLNDIRKNQLPGLLGGVGPIHSLVQLVQGFRDLVWLPIEQYRKDGRIVRGIQRGAASFGTSTAMAALELTNRMVRTVQAAAETAYDMVSPGPDESELKRIKRFSHHRLAHQPVDLREGVAKAYSVVKEGITDTALTIYDTATREHEQRGVTGAVGGVLRQLPPAVVKPLIVATEATSNVLGGMRNQIHPDARQEESQKWRLGEE